MKLFDFIRSIRESFAYSSGMWWVNPGKGEIVEVSSDHGETARGELGFRDRDDQEIDYICSGGEFEPEEFDLDGWAKRRQAEGYSGDPEQYRDECIYDALKAGWVRMELEPSGILDVEAMTVKLAQGAVRLVHPPATTELMLSIQDHGTSIPNGSFKNIPAHNIDRFVKYGVIREAHGGRNNQPVRELTSDYFVLTPQSREKIIRMLFDTDDYTHRFSVWQQFSMDKDRKWSKNGREVHREFRRWYREEIESEIDQLLWRLNRLAHQNGGWIEGWRRIDITDKWNPVAYPLGIYWAYEREAAEAHWGSGSGSGEVCLHARIHPSQIDLFMTIGMGVQWGFRDEKEIRVIENGWVELLDITDERHGKTKAVPYPVRPGRYSVGNGNYVGESLKESEELEVDKFWARMTDNGAEYHPVDYDHGEEAPEDSFMDSIRQGWVRCGQNFDSRQVINWMYLMGTSEAIRRALPAISAMYPSDEFSISLITDTGAHENHFKLTYKGALLYAKTGRVARREIIESIDQTEWYLEGGCLTLAFAIHWLTGYPVVALSRPQADKYLHFAVRLPDGRGADASGIKPLDQLAEPYAEDGQWEEVNAYKFITTSGVDQADIDEAVAFAREIFGGRLPMKRPMNERQELVGGKFPVMVNPSVSELVAAVRKNELRGCVLNGDVYVWAAKESLHLNGAMFLVRHLGITLASDETGYESPEARLWKVPKLVFTRSRRFSGDTSWDESLRPIGPIWGSCTTGVGSGYMPIQQGSFGEHYAYLVRGLLRLGSMNESQDDDYYEDEDEDEDQYEPQTFVLKAGTRVFHGTSSREFTNRLDYPCWVSDSPAVAKWFSTWKGDQGRPRVMEYEVTGDVELLLIRNPEELEQFKTSRGYEGEPMGSEELCEIVLAAGYNGWIIPKNYPEGDDIMLGQPCLRWVRTRTNR